MDLLALLQASARCHAAAGHWRRAAARWAEAGQWVQAGRCFQRAGLDGQAEDAWVRAGDPLRAARACRRLGWPERALRRYQEALSGPLGPEEEVEALSSAALAAGVTLGRFGTPGVRHVATPSECTCVAFLPGRRSVFAGPSDGRVVRVEPGGSVVEVEGLRMPGSVYSLAFSPGGDRLAVGCRTGPGAVLRVWEWRGTGPEAPGVEDRVPEGDYCFPPCAFSPDGRSLAWSPAPWGPSDLVLLDSGRRRVVPAAHGSTLRSLTYTPDGSYLLTASDDNTVVLRDAAGGEPLAPPLRFGDLVHSVVVHPAAALVAVGSNDGAVHPFRLGPGPRLDPVGERRVDRFLFSVAFSPDGRYLLALTADFPPRGDRLHLLTLHLSGGR